jgi:hypothetical protein
MGFGQLNQSGICRITADLWKGDLSYWLDLWLEAVGEKQLLIESVTLPQPDGLTALRRERMS